MIVGLAGNNLIEGAVTRTVYLDFNTYELPGQHFYTQAERDAIQAQITADYSAFSYTFTQEQPQSGPYTAIYFNDPALVGLEGGIASEIDWRDLDISGTTTLTDNDLEVIPADSGGVNVNNFLGGPGEPAATSADFIGLSATIAAHELGHLSGLVHTDAYGPVGSGIYSGVNPDLYNPPYPGPVAANQAILDIMASGASVNATLEDAINDPFISERDAIALSFGENGSPTAEEATAHYSTTDAQPVTLAPLVVPDTDLLGVNTDKVFDVTAADVVGYLGETNGASNTDFYSFTAQAGTLINFQLMSANLTRSVAPAGTPPTGENQGPFNTYLVIYDSSGQVIEYNDDSFQGPDSFDHRPDPSHHGHLLRDGDLVSQFGGSWSAVDRRLRAIHVHFRRRDDCGVSLHNPRPWRHDVRRLGRRHDHRRLGRRHDRGPATDHDRLRVGRGEHAGAEPGFERLGRPQPDGQ